MSLKANLKRFYVSPWFYILFIPVLALAVALYFPADHVSEFVYDIPIVNVYLTVFVPVFSVYAVHSIREIEWSIKSRFSVTAKAMVSANLFCLSSVIVPVIFIFFGCIQRGLTPALAVNYSLYIIFLTAVQIFFLSPLGFFIGSVIKNKAAYACAVLLAIPFTPILQNILMKSKDNGKGDFSFTVALSNLINLSLDDPSRVKYAGYGMPFNSETILSWIITVLCGLIFVFLILAVNKCFKVKGTLALCVLSVAVIFSGVYCTNLYFDFSPIIYVFNYQYTDKPPIKIDTANLYNDPSSPIIDSYNMKLETGNIVKNLCELELKVNGNSSVKLRLDQRFEIHSLTIDGEKADYTREGDYFTANLDSSKATSVIAVEYSGRINYADNLNNKVDVCDYTGGFLSEMFAWYPKLLSTQNAGQPKDFTVEINAVNSFVTNLDGYTLHPSGKQTVKGEKKDILFYLGYIGETDMNDMKVILPLEYLNTPEMLSRLGNSLSSLKQASTLYTYKNLFLTRYEGPYYDDFKKTDTTMISYEELKTLLDNWLEEVSADENEKKAVEDFTAALEDMWDDSLAEKIGTPGFFDTKEGRAMSNLISALTDVWDRYTFGMSDEELSAVKTAVVIPYSYNTVATMYIFEDCFVVSEGCLAL